MLKYPKLEYTYSFKKENEELRKRAEPLWGNSVIYNCPTTINIFPHEEMLEMIFNGQGHHYHFNLTMPDEERYEKIYKLLEKSIDKGPHPMENTFDIYPDVFKPKSIDYNSMSKDELLKVVLSMNKNGVVKNNKRYFDSNILDTKWVDSLSFVDFDKGKIEIKQCTKYKTGTLLLNKEGGDTNTLLEVNKIPLNYYVNRFKLKKIFKLTVNEFYILPGLTTTNIDITGTK